MATITGPSVMRISLLVFRLSATWQMSESKTNYNPHNNIHFNDKWNIEFELDDEADEDLDVHFLALW